MFKAMTVGNILIMCCNLHYFTYWHECNDSKAKIFHSVNIAMLLNVNTLVTLWLRFYTNHRSTACWYFLSHP